MDLILGELDRAAGPISRIEFISAFPPYRICQSIAMDTESIHMGGVGGLTKSSSISKPPEAHYNLTEDGQPVLVGCVRVDKGYAYVMYISTFWRLSKFKILENNYLRVVKFVHVDECTSTNQFAIQNDVIYVPSRSNNSIVCYDTNGVRTGKGFAIKLADNHTFINLFQNFMILSQTMPSLVVCMDNVKGNQIWKIGYLVNPQCMAIDPQRDDLLVYTESNDNKRAIIVVLDPASGKFCYCYKSCYCISSPSS